MAVSPLLGAVKVFELLVVSVLVVELWLNSTVAYLPFAFETELVVSVVVTPSFVPAT